MWANRVQSELDKEVAHAIINIAPAGTVEALEALIDEALELYTPDQEGVDGNQFTVGNETDNSLADWDLEAELAPWHQTPTEELWQKLGPVRYTDVDTPEGRVSWNTIIGMEVFRDPYQEYSSWKPMATWRSTVSGMKSASTSTETEDRPSWWQSDDIPEDRKTPLVLSHHQVVGIIKATEWISKGEGGLIADAVGVGKTGQVIGAMQLRWNMLLMQLRNVPLPLGELFSH